MKFIGNILWILFTGLILAVEFIAFGLLWCITIIGIPFGIQSLKLAKLIIWPFGKEVDCDFSAHPLANILWIIFGGLYLSLNFLLLGLLWCVTIVGIPFGIQCFKFAKLAIIPFGAKIR